MVRFIAWRLVQFPLVLAIIYLSTFFLAWIAPGDPFQRTDRQLSREAQESIRRRMHAETWYSFLGYYPWRMLHLDFGYSLTYEEWTVNDILDSALPVSLTLGLFAMTIATVVGTTAGTLAAVRRDGPLDWISLAVSLVGISVPSFVMASLLLIVFAARLRWFSIGGRGHFSDMILPGLALSLAPMAYIVRLTRVSVLDTLGNDYVRTARAKGLSRSKVIWKHVLRNAFLPVLSFLGPAAAATLTGSFIVEKVFNIPGLGPHFINGVLNKDQTLILGTVMVYSTFVLAMNLLVDISYSVIDPRIDITK